MKFSCDGQELLDAVQKVVKAAAVRTTSPILECIKLKAEEETLTLMCTDLELTIIKTIKAEVKNEGEVVIPAKFFAEFARKISNEQITFSKQADTIEIFYGENTGVLQCMDANEFPKPKILDEPQSFVIKANDLRELVIKSSVAVSQDDSRPLLRGVFLEVEGDHINGVALDGVRMALIKKPIQNPTSDVGIVVSARSLLEIIKLLPEDDTSILVQTQSNFMKIDLGDTILITRLLGQKNDFVNYRQILPQSFQTSMVISRQKLYDAIERASLLNWTDRNHIIKLVVKKENLTLTSQSEHGNITENIKIEHDNTDITIDFNGRLIIDCLHVIGDDFIKVNFCGPMSPCLITANNDEGQYMYLVLPMRV